MSHKNSKKGSLPRKGKHWAHSVREIILCKNDGSFNLKIDGGAENGEFVYIGGIKEKKVKYKKGKFHVDDLLLEVNGNSVAGYTRPDFLTLINKDGKDAVSLRAVKPGGGIMRDLCEYLAMKHKDSPDSALQQTIRDNLYRRTVPCTTRYPRDGEIPGVDYVFLTLDEFKEMERKGAFIETGNYEGNFYGTPKPPKMATGTLQTMPKPASRPPRPKSINMMESTFVPSEGINEQNANHLGPLPPNWEVGYSEDNEKYFINHETGTTQWTDPRLDNRKKDKPADQFGDDGLPEGWERVDDPDYGTYYIDHHNMKTQYDKPRFDSNYYNDEPYLDNVSQPPAYNNIEYQKYTIEGRQFEGELIRTTLVKGSRGFGFTIIGGDEPGELLQIKSVVPDGAAAKDGLLRVGDALVRLNGKPVVHRTHQEVVSMFQHMPINDDVEMEMIRGYPLPFDPEDPNVETIGSYTVVRSPTGLPDSPGGSNKGSLLPPNSRFNFQKSASDQSLTSSTASGARHQGHPETPNALGHANIVIGEGQGQVKGSMQEQRTLPRISTSGTIPRGAPEVHHVKVVKGPMGFGFTIADSPYGQKVKQILDAPRCVGLLEGDILMEINNKQIRRYTHKEAVELLKQCPKGKESMIVIQRGVIPTSSRNSPQTGRREEELRSSGRKSRPKSTPPLGVNQTQRRPSDQKTGSWNNLATPGEITRNQETGYRDQPHSSLRRGQDGGRPTDQTNGPYDDVVNITIRRGDMGFGFRVVGGKEEDTQASIGTVVPGSPAEVDGNLQRDDIIVHVDNKNVIGSSHHHVISLIHDAAAKGWVMLGIQRGAPRTGRSTPARRTSGSSQGRLGSRSAGDLTQQGPRSEDERGFQPTLRDRRRSESDVPIKYRDVTLTRAEHEGFGFVVTSSHESGSTIGRIVPGSPADRSRELFVGDKLVAVNGKNIGGMHHSDIVNIIKDSGETVDLTIVQKPLDSEDQRMSYKSAPNMNRSMGDGYVSDGDFYRRKQRDSQRRREEEEEAFERERQRREREEKRIQEERRREEERRETERLEAERREAEKREAEKREAERREAEKKEAERKREVERREEERKREDERRQQEELRREDERRWTQERDEDRRWDVERKRQIDQKRFEEEKRHSGRFDDGIRRNVEYHRQDEIRKREQESSLQEELRRKTEDNRRQEEIRRRVEEEARHQEERSREDERRKREEEQIRKVAQNTVSSAPPAKKAPPPVPPKPSKAKVQQARDERMGYTTLPARQAPPPQSDRFRRLSGGDPRPKPAPQSAYLRGKSESDLGRAIRTNDDEHDIIEVELLKKSQGYGFSIRGGRELGMPIFVLKIAETGIAGVDGRLKVGDEILQINNHNTKDMLHTEAIDLIRNGSRVRLTLKRSFGPPVFDTLPNGGPRSLPRTQYGRTGSSSSRPPRPVSYY